jgi:hypothetical protein
MNGKEAAGASSAEACRLALSAVPKGKPMRRASRRLHQSVIPALRNASYRWSKSLWSWYSNIACQ